MAKLQLITLGTARVLADDQDITAKLSVKAVALLVYLARQSQPQPREYLAELLWPDRAAGQALGSLRTALSKVRPLTGEALHISHHDIGLDATLDATTFEALAQDSTTRQAALNLYHGGFMAGFFAGDARGFEDWQLRESERLLSQFIQTSQQHIQDLTAQGQNEAAILCARHALTHAPLWEDFHRTLIQLYLLTSERAAALHQYRVCKNLLWEGVGVEPDASTQALFERVKSATVPPMPTSLPVRARLPGRMTSFIGRSEACKAVESLLNDHALVTVYATGGAGKTRLALEIAHHLQARFKDGAAFVDLTSAQRPEEVPAAVACALGIQNRTDAALYEVLAEREMLLILDNFEHVIEAAEFVSRLIEHASRLKLLITSREPLKLYGEQLYRLGALGHEESCQLFYERGRASAPDFRRNESTDTQIDAICAQLDGLPLAIELAATRARTHSLEEIRRGLSHPLGLLTTDLRNLPRRQRTIYDTIDWSYRLLTDEQAALFRALAVFRGGWTRRALTNISPHAAYLDDLVDKNLVRRTASDIPRYSLAQPVREYAAIQLQQAGETAQSQDTLASWALMFAEDAVQRLKTPAHAAALVDIREEDDNIHAALDSLAPRPDRLTTYAGILSALGWVWHIRPSYHPVYPHFQSAMSHLGALPLAQQAALLTAGGHIANSIGQFELSAEWQTAALQRFEALKDENGIAYTRFYLTGINTRAEQSKTTLYELRQYAFTHQDDYLLALVNLNLGWALYQTRDFVESGDILREGLATSERHGYQLMLIPFCINLAALYSMTEAEADALKLLERARLLSQLDGNMFLEAICTLDQCQLLYNLGQWDEALRYLHQADSLAQKQNTPFIQAGVQFWTGLLASERGEWAVVRAQYGQCMRTLNPDDGHMLQSTIDLLLHIALLLSARGHVQLAARLLGGTTAYQARIQCAYSPRQQHWLTRITEALITFESAPSETTYGASLEMDALMLLARDSLTLLT